MTKRIPITCSECDAPFVIITDDDSEPLEVECPHCGHAMWTKLHRREPNK